MRNYKWHIIIAAITGAICGLAKVSWQLTAVTGITMYALATYIQIYRGLKK